jgi:GAF domain-containing protein
MPNITYMSIVQYVDSDRVALSRQFFNKTAANLEQNPTAQVLVVDPGTIDQYVLDLEYLVTENAGLTFEAMRSNLEAVSAHTRLGAVARLRGVDIHRVVACTRLSDHLEAPLSREFPHDTLRDLDEFVRRLRDDVAFDDAAWSALDGLDSLFGFTHSILLLRDGPRLVGFAANGYGGDPVTEQTVIGDGLIGVAAQRREVVSVAHLGRSRIMADAVDAGLQGPPRALERPTRALELPGPRSVQSIAAVPLVANGELIGALYLESEHPGALGPHRERLLRILGAHVAGTLSALSPNRTPALTGRDAELAAVNGNEPIRISYYQADDSVFADNDYVIKGVPGRILWKLLRDHVSSARVEFTNRELRLDEGLGLPVGNDNLDSRLVALRRRLDAGAWGIRLERIGRGRLRLELERRVSLSEVPTEGPMRYAHAAERSRDP